MGEIPLHGKLGAGKVALVDDQDLPLLAGYRFTLGRRGYARAHVPREGRTPTTIELHLLLRDEKGRLYRDHINGDKLDNRRCNLRPATAQENAFNQKVNRTNKCGLKGVRQVGGLLEQMFTASQQSGGGVHRKLMSGLHLKVGVRGERRMVIVWREGERLPSAKECEVVGEDAGFYEPKYRTWPCKESEDAFLIEEGYRGPLCDHAWGFQVAVSSDKATGYYTTCTRCGIKAQVLTPKRGKKQRYGYGKWELRPHVFERWTQRGPAGDDLGEQPHHSDEGSQEPPVLAAMPPAAPAHALTRQGAAEAAKRAEEQRREALANKLRAGLLVVSFWSACVNRWFRHATVIGSRRSYLTNADLETLQDEVSGGWFTRSIRWALPYALLLCRWRHLTRALPLVATPAPKASRPRKKAVA